MNVETIFPTAIDNSMRKELVKCQMAFHYKYEQGLRANEGGRVDLIAGKAFAAGLERLRKGFYIVGEHSSVALSHAIGKLYYEYGSFVPPPKSNKTAGRMAGALAFYAEQVPLNESPYRPLVLPDGTHCIEVGFNYPIPIDHPANGGLLTYCGRFDMLARNHEDGSIWVVDEKTTSQMGEKWANQWLLDSQMTGYCWGANKLLEQHGFTERVKGAIINGIAIRLRDYEHGQFHAIRPDWMIERWYKQMLNDVKGAIGAYLGGDYNQALDHACAFYNNPCEFAALCQSRNPERLIEGSYQVVRWNPLTREES